MTRSALWLPLFDGLADPVVAARLAGEAEAAGWHGFFVWDRLSWPAPVRQVADPWITLAAVDRLRGQMLGEAMLVLTTAWSGEPVHHRGEQYTIDGIRFLPRPVQRPRVPVWVAGYPGRIRPLRRAAHHDGYFPIDLEHPDQLAEIVATLTDLRGPATTPYDVAVALPPGVDPEPYIKAGATWWMPDLPPEATVDEVRGLLREGPYK
ncbi:LLM class flavin-dependent oxidoreductase [Phytohabitans flavus]|uniref:LLM class flavin-dependent oxidoreductase n=1 Tax=Phytohabitans flavus TaxID=1076124 RepID=UPI00362D1855